MKCIILFVLLLSGCANFSVGNIPSVSVNTKNVKLKKEDKKDLTFSFSFYEGTSEFSSSLGQEKMIKTVKDIFGQSGLFNKVHYISRKNLNKREKFHIHFDVKTTATPLGTQAGLFAGSFLTIIPTWINIYADTTMYVFQGNKEIYSLTAAENIKEVIWLPLIVLSPFLNHATVGAYVRNKTFEYFLNAIIEEKLYE